jgi:ribonucleoside-diphosphate reductase alpha chain
MASTAELHTTLAKLTEALEAKNARIAALEAELETTRKTHAYRKRPSVMRGRTVETRVGCGPLYITLNEDENGKPFEVFFKLGKSGSCQQSYLEALGVAMSVGLRYGADPQKYVEKLEGMRCPNPKMRDASGPATLSCADGISKGLAKAIELAFAPMLVDTPVGGETNLVHVAEPLAADPVTTNGHSNGYTRNKAVLMGGGICPKCSGNLAMIEGCQTCLNACGYSKCG